MSIVSDFYDPETDTRMVLRDEATGCSTSGMARLCAWGIISWKSQPQSSVAISTIEAEIAASTEIVWIKRLFEQIIQLRSIPIIMVDNEAAIKLAQNHELHRRTKHIRIRHFFTREFVMDNEISIKKLILQAKRQI